MAGARKQKYHDFVEGGRKSTGHMSESPNAVTPGGEQLNQEAPNLHMVDRCPANEGQYDENFAHRIGEVEK